MKLKKNFADFQILGPLGCQGWVVIPQNVKKSKNHCTLVQGRSNGSAADPSLTCDLCWMFYINNNKSFQASSLKALFYIK